MFRLAIFVWIGMSLTCGSVYGQQIEKVGVVQRQILSTVDVCSKSGTVCIVSSINISKTSKPFTSSAKSSSGPTKTPTASTTSVPSQSGLAITTTFTQPPECTADSISRMAWDSQLWKNFIDPVPSSTFSSCFPSQLYSSVLAVASGTTLPAFRALICPQDWENYKINATYIICCPSGFGFISPNITNSDRPGLGAICTSSIVPGALMDITSFGLSALASIIPATAGVNGTIVLADAYDGIMAPATGTSISSTTSSTNSSSTHILSSTHTSSVASTVSTSTKIVSSTSKLSMSSSSAPPSSTSAVFKYVGCYTEATTGHALSSDKLVNHQTMTVELCESYCGAYMYIGLEYRGECYCGNVLGSGSVAAPETDCNDPCDGNPAQKCGSGKRFNLWKRATA